MLLKKSKSLPKLLRLMEIRLHQRRVLREGKDVKLSKYEYGVLVFLAQKPGWLCSRE